ncbi:diguanylate cyclase [Oscillatoriales cyanobacterium USR001]|nr:diguanylate cyclase [Oscillatoriales cyanobacterium USR001]
MFELDPFRFNGISAYLDLLAIVAIALIAHINKGLLKSTLTTSSMFPNYYLTIGKIRLGDRSPVSGMHSSLETLTPSQCGSPGENHPTGNDTLETDDIQKMSVENAILQEQKRLKAALRTSEAKYRVLAEQIPAVSYIAPLDRPSYRFYISPQIVRLLGYSLDEWKAYPNLLSQIIHPDDRDRLRVEDATRRAAHLGRGNVGNHPFSVEYRAIAKNGRVLWFRDQAVPLLDEVNQSIFLQGLMFDITESKAAEKALQQSEYRYYTLAKMLPVGIFRTETGGECLYVNQRFCEMAGLTPAEALRSGWVTSLHPDDRDRVLTQWYQGITEKMPFNLEYRFENPEKITWVYCQVIPEITETGQVSGYLGTLTDISDRKQVEEALRQAESKYRSIFENASEGIFQTTLDGKYLSANPALARIYGYNSPAELIDQIRNIKYQIYVDPRQRDYFTREIAQNGFVSEFESEVYRADGSIVWISENARGVYGINGELLYYEGTAKDITARKIAEQKLLHDALHDTLTGLPNRALFMERLGHAIEVGKRRPENLFAVLFIDLDRFKVVNDSLGHLVGDQLLIAIAGRLKICLRLGDTVARLGGDEFAILLENIKDPSDATIIAERVQKELALPFYLNEHKIFSSASIGIVCSGFVKPKEEENTLAHYFNPSVLYDRPEDLLRDADAAMYHAKAQGKARHEVFNMSMHTRAVALLELENDLRLAVERQEFRLYYQPIVALKNGKISGFEVLLRWEHPHRGLLSPAEFIQVAEETRLIVPIGWWMLRSACQQMYEWQQEFPLDIPLTISVNLSNQQFTQPDLIDQIQLILSENKLHPGSLKLEITESIIMENADNSAAVLTQLRALDIQLYIDDFGTGYSSLSRLHSFPTDAIKIDRVFVSRMAEDEANEAIVQTILILASHLGMEVIAEGVETAQQLAQLRALQCEYGQGYFFSKPVEVNAARVLVESQPQW